MWVTLFSHFHISIQLPYNVVLVSAIQGKIRHLCTYIPSLLGLPPTPPLFLFFFNLFSESPGSTSWATLSFPCWLFHSILPNSVHLFSVYHHFIGDVHLAPSLHWQLLNVCLKPASHWQSRSPFKLPHGGQSCLVCISNSTCSMPNPCILPARISPLPLLISINATSLLSGSLNWSSQTFFSSQQTSI